MIHHLKKIKKGGTFALAKADLVILGVILEKFGIVDYKKIEHRDIKAYLNEMPYEVKAICYCNSTPTIVFKDTEDLIEKLSKQLYTLTFTKTNVTMYTIKRVIYTGKCGNCQRIYWEEF